MISPNTQAVYSYECIHPFQYKGERTGKPCGKTFILVIGSKRVFRKGAQFGRQISNPAHLPGLLSVARRSRNRRLLGSTQKSAPEPQAKCCCLPSTLLGVAKPTGIAAPLLALYKVHGHWWSPLPSSSSLHHQTKKPQDNTGIFFFWIPMFPSQ